MKRSYEVRDSEGLVAWGQSIEEVAKRLHGYDVNHLTPDEHSPWAFKTIRYGEAIQLGIAVYNNGPSFVEPLGDELVLLNKLLNAASSKDERLVFIIESIGWAAARIQVEGKDVELIAAENGLREAEYMQLLADDLANAMGRALDSLQQSYPPVAKALIERILESDDR